MIRVGCTLLLGMGLAAWSSPVQARRAPRAAPRPVSGPHDAKELHPQAKKGDPEDPRQRALTPGVLPPRKTRRVSPRKTVKRSLETDPVDLIRMPLDRDRSLQLASPRLRSGAWFSLHILRGRSIRFRKYEPEVVYDKLDTVVMAEVGGALRLGRFELSLTLPVVGQFSADFYEKGVVDHSVTKVDRMDMAVTGKVSFSFESRKHVWLLTPYFVLGLPTGDRKEYSTSIGGRKLVHYTSGPRAFGAMGGVATGWRYGMLSVVVSVGVLLRMLTNHGLTPVEDRGEMSGMLIAAYQLAFSPWRDLSFVLGLMHLNQITKVESGARENLVWACLGLRFQPWAGLFGEVGLNAPLEKRGEERAPVVLTLSVGWEFQ